MADCRHWWSVPKLLRAPLTLTRRTEPSRSSGLNVCKWELLSALNINNNFLLLTVLDNLYSLHALQAGGFVPFIQNYRTRLRVLVSLKNEDSSDTRTRCRESCLYFH